MLKFILRVSFIILMLNAGNKHAQCQTCYCDLDGDGFGGASIDCSIICNPGWNDNVYIGGDCHDMHGGIYPGAPEVCDGLDNDCNGIVDDGIVYTTFYEDIDGDGFGGANLGSYCPGTVTIPGAVLIGGDCNDYVATTHPGALEICNNVDDDCNSYNDDGLTFIHYYNDTDGDGYGGPYYALLCYNPGPGFISVDGDCNDYDAAVYPGTPEILCNNIDDNCNGVIDEGSTFHDYYYDNDGDGLGGQYCCINCVGPVAGYAFNGDDCDDSEATIFPGAPEIPCNNVDENCNGVADEGTSNIDYYYDNDGDGFGGQFYASSCTPIPGGVLNGDDCNDNNAAVHPGAPEIACNSIDDNCNGVTDEGGTTLATPGSIITTGGSAKVCPGDTRTYTTTAAAGVTFQWTVPAGATINNGQGTDSINVTYDAGFIANGIISVVKMNACTTSAARTLAISRNVLATPSVITGTATEQCINTSSNYTVVNVAGANYNWIPPANASIGGGQGSNAVSVDFSANFLNGSLQVTAYNGCGTSNARSLGISSVPSQPGAITVTGGIAKVCPFDTRVYTTTASAGAVWNWTVPIGAIINSGQGTNSIEVFFDNNFTSNGVLSVVKQNACGNSLPRTLAITRNLPATPSAITGQTTEVCQFSAHNYGVTYVPGIWYNWSSPDGALIIAGQNTNSVIVEFYPPFTSGNFQVSASNGCGTSAVRSLAVSSVPAIPGAITTSGGIAKVCPGDSRTYTVPLKPNVTYNWVTPVGADIINGTGTNSITVSYNSNFTSNGTLSVTAVNSCGNSLPRNLTIQRNVPITPSVISGSTYNQCGQSNQAYAVTLVNDVIYNWTLPAGITFQSGQGSNSITAEFSNTFTSGAISVNANNNCGPSGLRSLTVRGTPSTPANLTGNVNVCASGTELYSFDAVPFATNYIWSKPTGSTILSGQGTTVMNLSYGANTGSIGKVSVKAVNNCGSSASAFLTIQSNSCSREILNEEQESDFTIIPNPNNGKFVIESTISIKQIWITDYTGRLVDYTKTTDQNNSIQIDLSNFKPGIYLVKLLDDNDEIYSKKVVVYEN